MIIINTTVGRMMVGEGTIRKVFSWKVGWRVLRHEYILNEEELMMIHQQGYKLMEVR